MPTVPPNPDPSNSESSNSESFHSEPSNSEPSNSKPSNSKPSGSEQWYIIKQPSGVCQILPATEVPEVSDTSDTTDQTNDPTDRKQWGPFPSQGEAIARRVGLIRSGKCQPQ